MLTGLVVEYLVLAPHTGHGLFTGVNETNETRDAY